MPVTAELPGVSIHHPGARFAWKPSWPWPVTCASPREKAFLSHFEVGRVLVPEVARWRATRLMERTRMEVFWGPTTFG